MREIDLAGKWQIRLEDGEEGDITLPGILQASGYGEEIGVDTDWVSGLHDPLWYLREEYGYGRESGVKVPFLSQPPRHYLGKAWYTRTFCVPEEDDGKPGRLWIECTKWQSEAWLDGKACGTDRSLCTPHEIFLGALTKGEHTLTVCIDNGMILPYRPDGHGVTEALGGGWNGMAGKLCVRLAPRVEIREVRVFPEWDTKRFGVKALVCNHTQEKVPAQLCLDRGGCSLEVQLHPGERWIYLPGKCGEERCWDEFTQDLEETTVTLCSRYGEHSVSAVFGFREIRSEGGRFLVNGRPAYFRGTHFGGDYPLTGYPECGPEWWRDKLAIIKEWGLNFIRFHSYCPPEAAFQAADELGVYLQVECGMWNVFREEEGSCPMADEAFAEAERIIRCFGNHPSFVMLSPSNEPAGEWLPPLKRWVKRCREEDKRRLYTVQSGWPYPMPPAEIEGTDYVYFHRSGYGLPPGGTIRNTPGWNGGDYGASLEGVRYPVICHELGQWCAYPDYSVTDGFRGYLRPGNFELFRESLKAHGMEGLDGVFAYHSGKLQTAMYKEELEANFRTPHLYGFELLDLHDYLGQGTALVGVLDAFWKPKGYVTPEEWRAFCGETVLLARLPKRVFTEDERLSVPLEICHFGREPIASATVVCRLTKRETVSRGTEEACLAERTFNISAKLGKNQEIGCMELAFPETGSPAACRLEIGMPDYGITNHWDLWVYPRPERDCGEPGENGAAHGGSPEGVRVSVTESWSEMEKELAAGGRVLFCPPAQTLDYSCPPFPFRPVFWNAQMGPAWGRGMGIVCDAAHPAFAGFPTDAYSDWQWEQALAGARGFSLEPLPSGLPLLVRAVDEWNRNRPMSLLFECRVGEGRLMLSSMDLLHGLGDRPAALALRKSLEEYMRSEEFQPAFPVEPEALRKNYLPHYRLRRKHARVVLEGERETLLPQLLDGDGATFARLEGGHPYVLRLEWEGACEVKGLYYLPRQNERNHEGEMRTFRVEAWTQAHDGDGKPSPGVHDCPGGAEGEASRGVWRLAAEGALPSSFEPKRILFDAPVRTARLRLTVLDGFGAASVTRYREERDGWHSSRGPWKDTCFSAAVLDILTDEEAPEEFSRDLPREAGEKSATREIDN